MFHSKRLVSYNHCQKSLAHQPTFPLTCDQVFLVIGREEGHGHWLHSPCNVGLDSSQPLYFSTQNNVRESANKASAKHRGWGGERAFCAGVHFTRRSFTAFNDRSKKNTKKIEGCEQDMLDCAMCSNSLSSAFRFVSKKAAIGGIVFLHATHHCKVTKYFHVSGEKKTASPRIKQSPF